MTDDDNEFNEYDDGFCDDTVFFQITGKGLHSIGAIDDNTLRHFQRVEEERDNYFDIAEAANEACEILYHALISVRNMTSDAEIISEINDALNAVSRTDEHNDE